MCGDLILKWLETHASVITVVVTVLALIIAALSFGFTAWGFNKERSERKREMEIRGKEKLLHAFTSMVFSNSPDHFPLSTKGYKVNPENIWITLDWIYSNPDLVEISNKLLRSFHIMNSIHDVNRIDREVREYYGMKEPEPIKEN